MKNLIDGAWNSANTNSVKPDIQLVYDIKRMNMLTGTTDTVYIYERATTMIWSSIGWVTRNKTTPVSIDIRSKTSRAQIILMNAEVDRIIRANRTSPIAGYNTVNLFDENIESTDLSDKRRNLWRYVYEIKLNAIGEAT